MTEGAKPKVMSSPRIEFLADRRRHMKQTRRKTIEKVKVPRNDKHQRHQKVVLKGKVSSQATRESGTAGQYVRNVFFHDVFRLK